MKTRIQKAIPFFLTLIILVGVFIFLPTKHTRAQFTANGPVSTGATSNPTTGTTAAAPSSGTGQVVNCDYGPGDIESTDSAAECTGSDGTPTSAAVTNAAAPSSGTGQVVNCDYGPGDIESTDSAAECTGSDGTPTSAAVTNGGGTGTTSTTSTASNNSTFQTLLNKNFTCSIVPGSFDLTGCFGQLTYILMMVIPAYILWVAAYFFNVFAYVTLSGKLFAGSTFIPTAWAVVRDLSNIFFILILLYIAIKLILGMGGHDTQKMVGKVIILALLINFSMFFTEVVIDSSNILAIIFYNKINVGTTNSSGQIVTTPYASATGEKDVAGGLTGAFNPANQLTTEFFQSAGMINSIPGQTQAATSSTIPSGIFYGIMLLSGAVMLIAAYALFLSGFSFLSRMVELFVLIIFSPFAFMSSSIPELEKIEYIGWHDWFKKLITVSFMAPIFMFFMYFIFMLIGTNIFNGLITKSNPPSFIENVLGIFLPASLIVILLLKATEYAKKGSGSFGELADKGARLVGGLALGAATGGVASVGVATVGRAGSAVANSKFAKNWEKVGFGGEYFRKGAEALGSSNFDVRSVKIGGKTLAGATGMTSMGEGRKGGFTERRKEDVEKRQKRAASLKVSEDEALMQNLHAVEDSHQTLLTKNGNAHHIAELDKRITGAQTASTSAAAALRAEDRAANPVAWDAAQKAAKEAAALVLDLQGERSAIKNATMFIKSNGEVVDHRQNTVDGNLSETAITGLARAAAKALALALANPANIDMQNASIVADAANYAAIATKSQTEAEEAKKKAAADPTNATLAAVATAAVAKAVTDHADANTAAAAVTAAAAAAPAGSPMAEKLTEANKKAADALARIANGLTGRSINSLEDRYIPEAHHHVEAEDKARLSRYAQTTEGGVGRIKDFVFSGGQHSYKGSLEAAHKIRMDAKLDSGHGGKGDGH